MTLLILNILNQFYLIVNKQRKVYTLINDCKHYPVKYLINFIKY